ncbi:hypothetical protein ACLE20_09690 [Rhizobium sp. YIM 134829]|uniref:hypothetical protein n=1 Tax=Rhizobium sp. YIM 134829 TaxID=3390453 RepID=UPI00397E20CF
MTTRPFAPRSPSLIIAPLAALAGLLSVASPAAAQSPKIEDVCVQVAKHLLMTETVHTGVVQAFPDLKPPGARMTYSTREGTEPKDMVDTISCEFRNTAAPFDLQRFCLSSTCYAADERNNENRRRFEEVRILLQRQGL